MEKKSLGERIVKNSFWNFSATLINRFGSLAFTIILARYLMPEGYGMYTIVFSTIMVFFIFVDLGISSALTRYLSEALEKNKKKIPSYYRYLLKIKIGLTLIVFFILTLLAYPLANYFYKDPSLFLPFLIAPLFVLITSFDVFHAQIFQAVEKTKYVCYREIITQFLRIGLVFLIFYFVSSIYHITGIFILLAFVHLVVLIWVLFYLKKLIPEIYHKPKKKINKKKIKRFIKFITIASISAIFFSYIDSIMLGFFLSAEYVGYYQAAFSIILGVATLAAFPNAILLPVFTKINNFMSEKIINKTVKYISILAFPSSLGLMVFARYFIRFLYGYEYLPAALPIYFLALLIFPIAFIGVFLSLFSAREKPQIFAKLIIIAAGLNILLNLIFIKFLLLISPLWAMTGVGIATLLSWSFYFFAALLISRKEFKIKISLRPTIKPIIASMIMAGVLFFILRSIGELNLISGILLIIFGACIHFLLMLLIKGINKEDLNLIKLLFKK